MKEFFLIKWLKNVSIARKLYFTVGLMALLIATELFTLMFAIKTLSSVRAYVGAEGLWSKAQKDAVYYLQKYGRTHNEKDYVAFQTFMKVPLGDRKARLELAKPNPDMGIARQGFLEGRVHAEDIDGAIKLFRRFNKIYYIHKAIAIWTKGDVMIEQLSPVNQKLHTAILNGASQEAINNILLELDPINENLTKLEDEFSFTLGEGSRWLANLILELLFALVLTVEVSGLSITILVSRSISRGLNEIIDTSEHIAKGDYTVKARVFSKDEIGILANSFNEMTMQLRQNIDALEMSKEELKAAKNIAEESSKVKEHFLANMSHEIRTPMNAVIGFTNLLEETELNEHQHKFLEAIKVSSKGLMDIINDILDLSLITSGKISLEQVPFSLRSIIRSLQALFRQRTDEKHLHLEFDIDENIPEMLPGDPVRLMQILVNLVENAIKFTDKGGVYISATVLANSQENTAIAFKVEDTGKGIPSEKQVVVFDHFAQENVENTRRYGGAGLGLSIAKDLVELHGSSISLKSEVNKGSAFSFIITYPKIKTTTLPAEFPTKVPAESSKSTVRVLVVEDNPLNQKVVQLTLKKYGMLSEVADNGKIAVDKLRADDTFDIVLMDLQMPEMDGYEATHLIRNELKSQIPIIALTAHAINEEKIKCLEAGMNEFIAKPFDPVDLQNKILSFV
jgi:signal transduction histidine kinase